MTKVPSDGSSSSDGGIKGEGRVSFDESQQLKKKEVPKEKPVEVISPRWSYDDSLSRQAQSGSISQGDPSVKVPDGTVKGSVESRASFESSISGQTKPPEVKVVSDSKPKPDIKVIPEKPKVTPSPILFPEKKGLGESIVTQKKELKPPQQTPKPPQQTPKPPTPIISQKKPLLPKDIGKPSAPPPKSTASLFPEKFPKLTDITSKSQTPPSAKTPSKGKTTDLGTKLKEFLNELKRQAKEVLGPKKSQPKKMTPTNLPKERSKDPYPSLIIMADQKGGAAMGRAMKFPYTLSAQIAQFPWKFHMNNNWMWKYYAIALGVCVPIFYKIGKASNTPENKRVWDENRRKAFTPGAHH